MRRGITKQRKDLKILAEEGFLTNEEFTSQKQKLLKKLPICKFIYKIQRDTVI